jgi:hypothetical protein
MPRAIAIIVGFSPLCFQPYCLFIKIVVALLRPLQPLISRQYADAASPLRILASDIIRWLRHAHFVAAIIEMLPPEWSPPLEKTCHYSHVAFRLLPAINSMPI